jgi:hypothetical protein
LIHSHKTGEKPEKREGVSDFVQQLQQQQQQTERNPFTGEKFLVVLVDTANMV